MPKNKVAVSNFVVPVIDIDGDSTRRPERVCYGEALHASTTLGCCGPLRVECSRQLTREAHIIHSHGALGGGRCRWFVIAERDGEETKASERRFRAAMNRRDPVSTSSIAFSPTESNDPAGCVEKVPASNNGPCLVKRASLRVPLKFARRGRIIANDHAIAVTDRALSPSRAVLNYRTRVVR